MKYLIIILALTITLTACNTFRGLGEDVSNLGSNIQRKAD